MAHDPLQTNTVVEGPNGQEQSRTWVIRKQRREKSIGSEDRVTPLAFYYIVNDTIFQAPSAADVLTNRMVGSQDISQGPADSISLRQPSL